MRLASGLCLACLLLGQTAPERASHGNLVVVAAEAKFLSAGQRSTLEQQGWNVTTLQVAEGMRRQYLQSAKDAPRAVFLGRDGAIRRSVSVSGSDELLRLVSTLEQGRSIFEYACVRCHGSDGCSDQYPGIRPLAGIGTRLSRQQIRERLHPLPMGSSGYTVRGHLLQTDQIEALVSWISGL